MFYILVQLLKGIYRFQPLVLKAFSRIQVGNADVLGTCHGWSSVVLFHHSEIVYVTFSGNFLVGLKHSNTPIVKRIFEC